MIPHRNRDIFIEKLLEGYTILEACKLSQISKASLYRMFKETPAFKVEAENAIFKAKDAINQREIEKIRKIVQRRR